MKFIDRENELKSLETKWREKSAHFFIIYGKRRVGKTELIKQFLNDKDGVYFLADKRNEKEQLRELGRLLGEKFNNEALRRDGFAQWIDVFEFLKNNIRQRFILAIDEYPYLVEGNDAVSSIFQKGWDEYLKHTGVFLILSGSSMAMMEAEALLYKSPLYGRRTGQLLIRPMQFKHAHQFFTKKSFAEFLEIYAVAGGTPAYLTELIPDLDLLENIKKRIFPPTEYLHNEIEFILKEELREPKNYLAIIRAIAWGKRKLGEIVNDTGLEKNIVTKYLMILDRLQIIEREVPITEKNPGKSRKGLYQICDNFVRFWFQYIYPFKSDLEIGRYDVVLRKHKESFQVLVAIAYEQVCRQLLSDILSNLRFEKIGKWWDKNEEIDIVAINDETKEILFGECKWSEKPVGTNIYDDLKRKAELVDWQTDKRKEYFILFSKSGFTDEMKKIAKAAGNIFLVKQDKLESYSG
jgi:hypothetical protein